MNAIEQNLAAAGITLPTPPQPVGGYLPWVQAGDLVYVSGQLPGKDGKLLHTGKVPTHVPPEAAKEAARLCAINAVAILKDACAGDLSRVVRIVRLGGFVQSENDFTHQPAVLNGASDLFVTVFGEAGKHARAAVGTNTLPLNATVELEVIAQIK